LTPNAAVHWQGLAIRGTASVLFGTLVLVSAVTTPRTLTILFIVLLLLNGLLGVADARSWKLPTMTVEGVADIAVALYLLASPGAPVSQMLLAAWAFLTGFLQVRTALRLRGSIVHEWPLLLGGIAAVVLGFALVGYRGLDPRTFWGILGEFAVVWGELTLIMAWGLLSRRRTYLSAAPRVRFRR
jgi:uncharacterized membrane protein HdeD (DUF308 family)